MFPIRRAVKTRNVDCDSENVLFAVELHYCTGLSASEVCHNEAGSVFPSVSVDGSVEVPHTVQQGLGREGLLLFQRPKQT